MLSNLELKEQSANDEDMGEGQEEEMDEETA
jgi:hypothetical protein